MSDIGVIFDWDGVIIDSSVHHEKGWERLAQEEGLELPPDHFKRGFGKKNEEIIPGIMQWTTDSAQIKRLSLRKEALYRELLIADGLTVLPGVLTFLNMLRDNGVPCAVGSSSHRLNIETALDLTDIRSFFITFTTSEDVTLGKPDPQVFLLCSKRIGMDPRRCVVFEDVPAGIEAAHRGGMKAVAVTTSHSRDELFQSDRIVDRLDQLDMNQLREIIG